jgi:hypothetical protein
MARGFESKSVESQQADAAGPFRQRHEPGDPVRVAQRKRLELARADIVGRLDTAPPGAYREILERSLESIDEQLSEPT